MLNNAKFFKSTCYQDPFNLSKTKIKKIKILSKKLVAYIIE